MGPGRWKPAGSVPVLQYGSGTCSDFVTRMLGFQVIYSFSSTLARICFVTVIKRHVILDRLVIQCLPRGMLPQVDSNRGAPFLNPLNPELNPICCLLALLGAHHFLHVSRIRVILLTFRLLMSYIYIYIYIWSTHS